MFGASRAILRRLSDSRFPTRYFIGHGIDIGAGNDCLSQYQELFPAMQACRNWDMKDGDAQLMSSIPNESFDFVHSSHCLEHMHDPVEAMHNWLRILKPNGHLVMTVPDEDLYEQGVFPSTFNTDHKWTFCSYKQASWSSRSINLTELIEHFSDQAQLLKMELLDASFLYHLGKRIDQTMSPIGECAIEVILRKLPQAASLPSGHLSLAKAALHALQTRPIILMAPISSTGLVFGPSIAAASHQLIAAIDDHNTIDTIYGAPRWNSTRFLEEARDYPDLLAINLASSVEAHNWVAHLCSQVGVEHSDWVFRSSSQ